MGTNYYARIIPTEEQKNNLKKLINENNFSEIRKTVSSLYSTTERYCEEDLLNGEVHLGKRSAGWKFLWNPNWYKKYKGHTELVEKEEGYERARWVSDGYDILKFYDLTKKSIKEFIDRENIEIYDEYDEKQDKEEFWKMAISWGYEEGKEGWDSESYEQWEMKNNPNYKPYDYETDYVKFIKECGFNVSKYNSDFMSDGMRFATTTDFC